MNGLSSIPQAPILPENFGPNDLDSIRTFYEIWFKRIIAWIVDRYEWRRDYPYLDTKFDVIRGRNFAEDDPVRGPAAVYGWIQGRGLESLVYHARWLRRIAADGPDSPQAETDAGLIARIDRIIRELSATLRRIRSINGGRMYFLMETDGTPRFRNGVPPAPDSVSYADLFVAKGLYAAATYLGDDTGVSEAGGYLREIEECIRNGRFVNGQYNVLDPAPTPAPGPPLSVPKREQGPYMILIGALALPAEAHETWCLESGLGAVEYILDNHVADRDLESGIRRGDMWEANDERNLPLLVGGKIVSDPGHSVEFTGLAARLLRRLSGYPGLPDEANTRIAGARGRLADILYRNFENGFVAATGGMVKRYDLVRREAIDPDMPWWNLPEAMRSAAEILRLDGSGENRRRALSLFARCHNALTGHYLVERDPPLWVQTRGCDGSFVDIIPACSDFDPGYHTNMSILEALDLLRDTL